MKIKTKKNNGLRIIRWISLLVIACGLLEIAEHAIYLMGADKIEATIMERVKTTSGRPVQENIEFKVDYEYKGQYYSEIPLEIEGEHDLYEGKTLTVYGHSKHPQKVRTQTNNYIEGMRNLLFGLLLLGVEMMIQKDKKGH